MVRLFIGIDLPCDITDRMRQPQEAVKESRARLSLVNTEIIHLTLKFLGEIPDKKVDGIKDALAGVSFPPFDLTVGCVSGNPPRQPRVLWCDVRDGGKTGMLHGLIEDALEPLGIPRDDRPFRPHVTIARVRQFDTSLVSCLRGLPPDEFGTCRVGSFQLKKSTLTPQGPVYETLLEVPGT